MNMQINHKTPVIRCPHCNAEYLPGEIYMPGAFIGKPDDVVKDGFGKILYEDYTDETQTPNMIEHFECEYCNKPFVVEATVAYKSHEELPENDFSTQYVSLLS